MAIEFNPAALGVFRHAKLENENAIANMDGNNAIKGNGTYKSGICVIFCSGDEKRANNEVRTQLLQSLGKAFGINSGIMTDANRQTTKTAGGEILNSWKFIPVLDNNSRQVVRPITEKDIDDLGEACLDVIFEG